MDPIRIDIPNAPGTGGLTPQGEDHVSALRLILDVAGVDYARASRNVMIRQAVAMWCQNIYTVADVSRVVRNVLIFNPSLAKGPASYRDAFRAGWGVRPPPG